jgi:putative cell wall-binding protein
MQFEITDAAALAFSRGLYRAIARNTPVDEAVRLGRIAIVGTSEQTLEWVTPVLYLRTAETCLFALSGLGERHIRPVETDDGDDDTTDSRADGGAGSSRRWAWLAGAVAIVVLGFVAARLFAGGGGTTATITRVQGPDRYATSAAVADAAFASTGARSAVIARGDDLSDALAAAALAGTSRGPVLLVPNDHLPDASADVFRRLGLQRAVVVGDDAAVSADVQRAVEALGVTTSRVAGGDPASVAAAVADQVQPGLWPGQGATAFLIDLQDVAAAATVGPIAFAEHIPILFTSRAELPTATREAMTHNGIAHVIVVGGPDRIPTAVETELRAEAGVTTQRLQSRSSEIVAIERSQLRWRSREVVLARGDNPADAIAAASLAGRSRAPLILTASRNELGADASAALSQLAGKVKNLVIVGDPTAVSEQLVSAAAARLRLRNPERAIVRA